MDAKKLLIAAAGTVAAGAVLYYLLKDDEKAVTGDGVEKKKKKQDVDEITKEQVQQILQEIIKSQDQMKGYMKELTKELLTKSLKFDETYKRVREVQPSDPLEKYGLSMMDFDTLLDKHQGDPAVRESIAKIMGAPNPSTCTSDKVQGISVKKIIDVHNFMQEELDRLVTDFHAMPNRDSYDMKTVTIAAQAIVGSKIEDKFGITSEDIESAVLMHHAMLATNQEFASINIKIQHTMGKLMGAQFAG
mmetsp:Transcript_75312/g.197400  ORF Transcript_75312/g.197400 Transcript_75312/m.197400 type:complete len:247 (-) Transcript_75312:312-1052(-)